MEGWGKIRPAAEYAGIKERLMRDWLKEGLPHARLPSGTILIRFKDIDLWLERFMNQPSDLDVIVKKAMRKLL